MTEPRATESRGAPGFSPLAYCVGWHATRIIGRLWWRVRYFGQRDLRRLPPGAVFASNHQSFADPPLIGSGLSGPIHYLARSTLFAPVAGFVLRAVAAHPVRRGAADTHALRLVLRLLRAKQALLVFPEGTRTRDGELGRFRPGAARFAVRTGAPIVPVCIEGAYGCWPRWRALPGRGRVAVAYGRPIESAGREAGELMAAVRAEVARMQSMLRRELGLDP